MSRNKDAISSTDNYYSARKHLVSLVLFELSLLIGGCAAGVAVIVFSWGESPRELNILSIIMVIVCCIMGVLIIVDTYQLFGNCIHELHINKGTYELIEVYYLYYINKKMYLKDASTVKGVFECTDEIKFAMRFESEDGARNFLINNSLSLEVWQIQKHSIIESI